MHGRGFRREPNQLALVQHDRAAHRPASSNPDAVRKLLAPPMSANKCVKIAAVELAGSGREPARQVDVVDHGHAVPVTTSPGRVTAQLPPATAAKSTITDP